MPEWITLATVASLNTDGANVLDADGLTVLLFFIDDKWVAIEDRCTHMDFPLSDGLIDDDTITCLHHGAQFCLKTGEVLSPPAFDNLTTFPTRIVDDKIQIEI